MITLNRADSFKKPLVIGVAIVALLSLLCVVYVYGFKGNLFGWSATTPPTKNGSTTTPAKTSNSQSTDNQGGTTAPTQTTSGDTKPITGSDQSQTSGTQANGTKVVELSIVSTNQTSSYYHIGVVIYSVVGSGTCSMTLSRDSYTTVTQTVGVQALASSSTCKGFDIPMTNLSSGTWHANVTFEGSSVNGSTSQDIKVN